MLPGRLKMKKAEFQTRRLEAPKVRADDGTLHLSGIIPYHSLSEDLGGIPGGDSAWRVHKDPAGTGCRLPAQP